MKRNTEILSPVLTDRRNLSDWDLWDRYNIKLDSRGTGSENVSQDKLRCIVVAVVNHWVSLLYLLKAWPKNDFSQSAGWYFFPVWLHALRLYISCSELY
jgi:hypothetical protein